MILFSPPSGCAVPCPADHGNITPWTRQLETSGGYFCFCQPHYGVRSVKLLKWVRFGFLQSISSVFCSRNVPDLVRLKNYNKVTAEEGERIKIAPPDWTNQSCESQIELDLLLQPNLIKMNAIELQTSDPSLWNHDQNQLGVINVNISLLTSGEWTWEFYCSNKRWIKWVVSCSLHWSPHYRQVDLDIWSSRIVILPKLIHSEKNQSLL